MKNIEYDLSFDTDVKMLVSMLYIKSESKKGNLSYIAINHFENYSLYDYEIGKWNQTRMYYGDIIKEYTIKLSSVRAGQKIDKMVIKYQKAVLSDGKQFVSNPVDEKSIHILQEKTNMANKISQK
jgi:hypothetical protein